MRTRGTRLRAVFATATLALVVRAAGGTPDGASFTASGKARFGARLARAGLADRHPGRRLGLRHRADPRPGLPAPAGRPARDIRPDGSFGGSERYVIHYRGIAEHYRVTFKGRFLADGAAGTLRARVFSTRPGKRRSVSCTGGTQTWTARA